MKVGDLVRFAMRAERHKVPIYWTGDDEHGALVHIPELTPALIVARHEDEEGNELFDVLVMNRIVRGWYDTSFEEYWDDLKKERLCKPAS